MKSFLYLLLLLTLANTGGGALLAEKRMELIHWGSEALLNGKWEEAHSRFGGLFQIDSADPSGYLFRAAVMQGEMMDAEENIFGASFLETLDSVKALSERWLDSCSVRDSAVCCLFIGHSYAYRSLWEARFGSKYSALTYGLKAKGPYHRGLAADSTLYDLYFGLGSYHYWKSVKAGILRSAGIFKNDKEKGIRELELAIDSSLFSRESARASLIWVWINEKQYDSAISLAAEMLAKYPDGNSFLWPIAEAYYKSQQYDSAVVYYSLLFERLKAKPGNYYNVIESAYWLIQALNRLNRKDSIGDYKSYIEDNYSQIPRHIKRKQKSKLASILRRTE